MLLPTSLAVSLAQTRSSRTVFERSGEKTGSNLTNRFFLSKRTGNENCVLALRHALDRPGKPCGHCGALRSRRELFAPSRQIPPHRHTRYSEQLYVVEGELAAWAGDRKVVLHRGENIFIPADTPHSLAVTGDGQTHILVVASPSGFARLVTEGGTPDEGQGMPPAASFDMDRFLRLAAELGDELLGPPRASPRQVQGLSTAITKKLKVAGHKLNRERHVSRPIVAELTSRKSLDELSYGGGIAR